MGLENGDFVVCGFLFRFWGCLKMGLWGLCCYCFVAEWSLTNWSLEEKISKWDGDEEEKERESIWFVWEFSLFLNKNNNLPTVHVRISTTIF